jgi:hypothetical protein
MSVHRSFVVFVLSLVVFCHARQAGAQSLITSASAVRLRAEASNQSRVVAELPFGTMLMGCDGAADGWLHVETADGRAGWVHGALVIALPESGADTVLDNLIKARLRRKSDGLAPRLELVALIERVHASRPEETRAARLDLQRLQALTMVLEALPFGADPGGDLRTWLADRDRFVVYHDEAGRYILRPEVIRKLHERHRANGAAAAEEILWLLVENGFPGACEGTLTCYIARTDAAEGDYLRWYPEGRHVDAAMRRVMERAAWWKTRVESGLGFDAATECRDIAPLLGAIRFGVETATHPDRQKAVALIDAVRWRCSRP